MFVKTVNLWENAPGEYDKAPALDVYIPEKKTSDIAVVVLPGGGYSHHAPHEGQGYAEFLNQKGITAFVLAYRVCPCRFPLPLLDARRAMRYVRHHSGEYNINKVYIMGSSAGGHLAALTATYREPIDFEGADEIDKEDYRPDGQILCYPVIALLDEEIAHYGSADNLLGDRREELGDALSPHLIANATAPRAFIWHTFADNGVNVSNSLLYAHRLKQVGVSTELHIYPYGRHGLGIAEDVPHVRNWTKELLEWLELEKD